MESSSMEIYGSDGNVYNRNTYCIHFPMGTNPWTHCSYCDYRNRTASVPLLEQKSCIDFKEGYIIDGKIARQSSSSAVLFYDSCWIGL